MKRLFTTLIVIGLAIPLSGCIVTGPGRGGGWCYWHPIRCR